jgi:bidirectional [NiFe] hydrogenase diaphorase subunit
MRATSNRIRTFNLDGRDVGANDGQSIMQVARENNIMIPALCHLEGLSTVGACRLCLVEIKGSSKLQPACTTEIQEGMEVVTNSERLKNYRRMMLELFFSERNHVCSVCVSNGHCELQNLALSLGMNQVRYPYLSPKLSVDASSERFGVDHNRCILCTRCLRVCDEIEGAHTWDIMGRGVEALVITDLAEPWGASSSCTGCSKCVQVCPTGALFIKGRAVGEMEKHLEFLPYLEIMRGRGT